MDDEQFSTELTTLLSKLNKGHSWDNQQVQALRAPERLIFTEAVEEKKKVNRQEFAEFKGKERVFKQKPKKMEGWLKRIKD